MLWKAPWLQRRIALMGLAAWDTAAVYASYNIIYLVRLNDWEGWNRGLLVAAATWLSISYLAGRYSPIEGSSKDAGMVRLGQTLLAGSSVLALFIGHSWTYQVIDAETRFRGFLLPLIALTTALSTAGQSCVLKLQQKRLKWAIICSEDECNILYHELSRESETLRSNADLLQPDDPCSISIRTKQEMPSIAVGEIQASRQQNLEALLRLREEGGLVVPLLSWCEHQLQRIPPELISTDWLIRADGFGLRPGSLSWRIKRLADVAGASGLLLITAPLLVVGGLLIWLEDQGPILYSQIRSGLYGRPIRIWKLRSMRTNSEALGAQWASRQDPRITKIGRLLRATRIDELPQLISVLNGDLSLIGPRPERPEIEEKLEQAIPHYRVRHWIRPGLSGWAQVCYPYGASIEDSRMKLSYDLYYLHNANIFLDVLITIKTIRLVAGAKGASPGARQWNHQ